MKNERNEFDKKQIENLKTTYENKIKQIKQENDELRINNPFINYIEIIMNQKEVII